MVQPALFEEFCLYGMLLRNAGLCLRCYASMWRDRTRFGRYRNEVLQRDGWQWRACGNRERLLVTLE
jgi:hypothetical protein